MKHNIETYNEEIDCSLEAHMTCRPFELLGSERKNMNEMNCMNEKKYEFGP